MLLINRNETRKGKVKKDVRNWQFLEQYNLQKVTQEEVENEPIYAITV